MQIINIAGYKFLSLNGLPSLKEVWLAKCQNLHLKGTILLSPEGVNLSLAGSPAEIHTFKEFLKQDARFSDLTFRESMSPSQPFRRMKIKLKPEIITLRRSEISPGLTKAPSISANEFKQWLDEKRDITILDTRNDYEIKFGTFQGATHLGISDFSSFPEVASQINPQKTIVMFCTGGIRCEKAALHLLNEGFAEVYQLEGGILDYFSKVGGEHYEGDCFVFDGRVSVNSQLQPTGTIQCPSCRGPVTQEQQCLPSYVKDVCCPACV